MILRKLSYNGACIDADDVHGEFWRGVAKGMQVVSPNVGDPVSYLIQRGVWQVKSVVRTELGKRMAQYCVICKHINVAYSLERKCERCGQNVENVARFGSIENIDVESSYRNSICSVVLKIQPTDVQRRVLELLIQCCIDGSEHPQADVARALGLSRERVRQHLERLRPFIEIETDL